MCEAGRTEVGVRGRSSEVTSATSSSSADWTHGGRERAARWRSRLSAAVELVLEDASVRGVLETLWLWLFRTPALSLWSSRETRETTLTREWGRCCEDCEEALGGGMGEGSSELEWELAVLEPERPAWVELVVPVLRWEATVVRASLGLRNDSDSRGPLLVVGLLEASGP